MAEEEGNPTPSNEGASTVHDRLERFLGTTEEPAKKELPAADDLGDGSGDAENEGEPGDEVADESSKEDGASEDEGPQISTTDLAAFLGVDESAIDHDENGAVLIKTKIDGQEGTAKFSDLLAAYQLRGHADNQVKAAVEQRKAAEAFRQQAEAEVATRVQNAEALGNVALQELTREYQSVDWNQLRAENPGEFAAKQLAFQNRNQQIQAVLQEAQSHRERFNAENHQRLVAEAAAQASLLTSKIPGWDKPETASAEKAEIRAYVAEKFGAWGEDPAAMNNLTKGVFVDILRDAHLYRKGLEKMAEVEKKVKAAPKLVRPGQGKSQGQDKIATISQIKANIKKSGGKTGVMDYLLASGKV